MEQRTQEIAERLRATQARVRAACEQAGRTDEPTLIVVTKFFPVEDVERLRSLGVRDIGENRDQEARAKVGQMGPGPDLRVHFIGQLQTNKAASVARYADVVHSVDRPRLVHALSEGAQRAGRELDVLVQVDLSDAPGRGGVPPARCAELAALVAGAPRLQLRGVMAVAPLGEDPDAAFARVAGIAAAVRRDHPEAIWLSAGMSADLEQAVRHGATHLRVGSAILGSRPPRR